VFTQADVLFGSGLLTYVRNQASTLGGTSKYLFEGRAFTEQGFSVYTGK
jgi:hypothetical protein